MKTQRTYTMSERARSTAATRDRIAEAARDLFLRHRFEDVTLSAIAEASGVSHQTVLNHFESKEGVVLGVVELMKEGTMAARRAEPGDVEGAVHALVGDYERMGDGNVRWATSEIEALVEPLDMARAHHQEWLVGLFGDQIPSKGKARQRAVNALHAATDVYTWKLLRRDLRLSRAETEKTMVDLVVGILRGSER
jgi:AcrR family transcriptional regulator